MGQEPSTMFLDRLMFSSSSTPSSSSYSSEAFRNAQYNRKYHGSDQFWSQQYQNNNHSNYTSKTSYYYNDGSDKSNQNPEYEEYSNPRSQMKNFKEKMANGIIWRHVLLFALCAFYVKKFIFRETGDKTDDIVAEKNPGYLSYKKPAKLPSRVTTNREEFLENRKKMKSYQLCKHSDLNHASWNINQISPCIVASLFTTLIYTLIESTTPSARSFKI